MRRTPPRRIAPLPLALALALLAPAGSVWWALAQPPPAAADSGDADHTYVTTIAAPDAPFLEPLLRDSSTLVELEDQGPIPIAILLRRALTDRRRLAAVLRSEGFFLGELRIEIAGVPVGDPLVDARIAAIPPSAPVQVTVTAIPGPRTEFGMSELLGEGGATLPAPARSAFVLPEGEPARGADVLAAEARAIDALRAEGHAFARFVSRDAVVDHRTGTMSVATTVDPGPRVSIGSVGITGTDALSERAVRIRAGLAPGTPFSPAAVEQARRAVTQFPAVAEVRAVLGTAPDPDGTVPLSFAITERPRRVIALAADYGSDEGGRLAAEWTHRNILGEGETLTARLEVNRLLSNSVRDYGGLASLRLSALDVFRRDQAGDLEARLVREREESYDRDAAVLAGSLARIVSPGITVRAGLQLEASEVTDRGETDSFVLFGVPLGITVDRRNSILNPTRGVRGILAVTPEFPISGDTPQFTRARLDLSGLLDLTGDGGTVLAGRSAIGILIGADGDRIPADRRYYAGGGGSVRGYPYQSLGPRDATGETTGGGSLVELSVELRQRVVGEWGVVGFVDAGNAFESRLPEGDLRIGAGVGVRYASPIGPIRLDIAVPFDPPDGGSDLGVEFYAGIGQAF